MRRTLPLILATVGVGLLSAVGLSGCSSNIIKHGQHFRANDLQQIQPGMSKDQVRLALGTPSTQSASTNGEAHYYISSVSSQTAFFKADEVDRQVVAIYYNPVGSVDRVANYGLKDGKVFDFISRKTPAPGAGDAGLVQQLFRNLGKSKNTFDPSKY
ncbi:MAG: outer membrane protein assembly factor BamE [Hyphomicrobiaceae bacterium]